MTISIDVEGLWDLWQPSQRDNNIHRPAVERYIRMFTLIRHRAGTAAARMSAAQIEPITFERLIDVDGEMRIRTADGRHRVTAAHELGMATIEAVDTQLARMIKEVFAL